MAIVIDSVDITGMRVTHFEQLYEYLLENERSETYYGNKKYYDQRHKDLKIWLESIIVQLKDSGIIIPKKST